MVCDEKMKNCRIIRKDDFVVDFILSDISEKLYWAESETMEDRVKYNFINGFIDVGDLPCRKKFWQDVKVRALKLPPYINWEYVSYNQENSKIDSSHFWHRPHHVSRWAKTQLYAPQSSNYRFRLTTCGGVYLWLDGEKVTEFKVYQRNKESAQEILLPLKKGKNELCVYFDDIAERDTYFYFQLQYLDKENLYNQFLDDHNDQKIRQYGDYLNDIQVRPSADNICLYNEHVANTDMDINYEIFKHPHENEQKIYFSNIWEKGSDYTNVIEKDKLGSGFWHCNINYEINGLKITKKFNFTVLPPLNNEDLCQNRHERFAEILRYLAYYGHPQICKVLAAFENEIYNDEIIDIIEKSLKKISERQDCSDFIMVPLLYIWKKYAGQYLTQNMWQRIKSTILGWRYWIDEPGNDVMWFWSENHCLCFHAAQYLAGDIFYDSLFINSNRKGYENKKIAHGRLIKWFDQFEKNGFVEWNSIAYYPIDLIALLTLYENAPDKDIKEKSKNALDNLFCMVAIHSLDGKAVGSMGRAYEKELLSADVNELSTYIHALWGHGVINRSLASLPLLLSGSYQPPIYTDIVSNWVNDTAFETRYFQGVNQQAKLVTWKNKNAVLSSVVDHFTGQKGHQQHIIDISFKGNPKARIWINHPGEKEPNGEARPSFWAGNGILPRVNQYRNRALIIMEHVNHDISFSHLYFPKDAFDEIIYNDKSIFFRCKDGYGAVFASENLMFNNDNLIAHENEIRLNSPHSVWYVCVGDINQDGGFENFIHQMKHSDLSFVNKKVHFNDPFIGEMSLSWSGEFTHDYLKFVPEKWFNTPLISLDTQPDTYFSIKEIGTYIK